jgi:hypothetical protein
MTGASGRGSSRPGSHILKAIPMDRNATAASKTVYGPADFNSLFTMPFVPNYQSDAGRDVVVGQPGGN